MTVVLVLLVVAVIASLNWHRRTPLLLPPSIGRRRIVRSGGARIVPYTPWIVPLESPSPATSPPPSPAHHDVLSNDSIEHELLDELRRDPSDAAARMVYSDLLEQRGHLAKANFVRGSDEHDDPANVLDDSDFAWRTITSREPVECGRTTCPQTWDLFKPDPADERQRSCFICNRTVRYCATAAEERGAAERGERGVIDLGGALRSR